MASSTHTSTSAISRHPTADELALLLRPFPWRFAMRVARLTELFWGMSAAYDGAPGARLMSSFVARAHDGAVFGISRLNVTPL